MPAASRSSSVERSHTAPPLVCDGRHRGEQQALRSAGPAVGQHRLKELDVDLAVPPRTRVSEHQGDSARSPTAGGALVDGHETSRNELLPCLLVAAPAQPGARGRGRRPRPGAVVAAGEARQRERHQALTRYKVGPRERGGDRLSAHPPHSTFEPVHVMVGFRVSVRGVRNLHSRPATDHELRLLPRSPSAAPTADPGVEAVNGPCRGGGCPPARAPRCRALNP